MNGEDDLKRQARRRLIGAVALVTAAVVILPMVLDGEPKPAGQNIELRIPDKDKAGEFTSQMVLPESAPVPFASSVAVAASQVSVVPAAPVAQASQQQPVKPEPVKQEATPPSTPVKKPEKAAKPEKVKQPAHAEKVHAAPKDGYALQVGAFAHVVAARELQSKLQKRGWHSYTEKAGDKTRVRVGAYPTRAAAEKELHKLEAQGMHPVVVHLN